LTPRREHGDKRGSNPTRLVSHGSIRYLQHGLDFYPSVSEFLRGGEKNSFALLGGFSYLRISSSLSLMPL
jgi:hypothetical protein